MTRPLYRKDGKVSAWVYDYLLTSTPEERTEIVLHLIEEHPEGRLDLPACNGKGAALMGVDLSKDGITARVKACGGTDLPRWACQCAGTDDDEPLYAVCLTSANLDHAYLGDAQLVGADLRNASLRMASFDTAHLREADLSFSSLTGANLAQANCENVQLPGADMRGCNLVSTCLRRANLLGADLSRANMWLTDLEKADLRAVHLSQAVMWQARLVGADLTGACLEHIQTESVDLRQSTLHDAHLENALLKNAHLEDAKLYSAHMEGCNLENAVLTGADLRSVSFGEALLLHTNMDECDLRGSHLERLDLSTTSLKGVRIAGAWLDSTRFTRTQIGEAIGEEQDGEHRLARLGYLVLKQNFESLGDYEGAAWAYTRERRMGKMVALHAARIARHEHEWRTSLGLYWKARSDQFIELLCDYGEGIWNVLGSLAVIWLVSALLYGAFGHVRIPDPSAAGPDGNPTYNPLHWLAFSLATMVTIELRTLQPSSAPVMVYLMPMQAFVGIFLAGLLGFVAGNRIRRS